MLAVCRALVLNQRLLLLDEPLEGFAPIIVEQHPQAILKISHRAVVLDHGNVVQVSDAQTLRDNPELLDSLLGVPRKLYLDERGETCSLKTPGMWPAP